METTTRQATQLNDAVAEELRALLARRRLRQSDLAERIGENEMWVSRRLRGSQVMTLSDLERIAEGLKVEPSDLLQAAAGLTTIRYDSDRDLWGHRPNVRQAVSRPQNRTDARSPGGRRTHRTNQSVRP